MARTIADKRRGLDFFPIPFIRVIHGSILFFGRWAQPAPGKRCSLCRNPSKFPHAAQIRMGQTQCPPQRAQRIAEAERESRRESYLAKRRADVLSRRFFFHPFIRAIRVIRGSISFCSVFCFRVLPSRVQFKSSFWRVMVRINIDEQDEQDEIQIHLRSGERGDMGWKPMLRAGFRRLEFWQRSARWWHSADCADTVACE